MQFTQILAILALTVAVNSTPVANALPEPYLLVREPGCIKRDASPQCGYNYIKRSEVAERDASAELYYKVRDPGCIKRDASPQCGYNYIKAREAEAAQEACVIKRSEACAYTYI